MSLLFADIFEAIRYLRLCKGTTEKGILGYVENRVGGCLSTGHMLKTIRALQKLVDEGVLVKKGNRYSFPTKPALPDDDDDEDDENDCDKEKDCEEEPECDESDDDDDDDEEEDDDDDDDDEEGSECPSPCPEDSDDDDDDDEEEEDDDDDDDDECDAKEAAPDKGDNEILPTEPICPDNGLSKVISNNQNPMTGGGGGGGGTSNIVLTGKPSDANGNAGGITTCPGSKPSNRKSGSGKNGKKKNMGKSEGEQKGGEGKTKGVPNLMSDEEKVKKRSISKHRSSYPAEVRKSRSKKSRPKHAKHHSRSPMKKSKAAVYSLKLDHSMEFGPLPTSSQLFPEATEAEMEVDPEKEIEGNGADSDSFRHRSPAGPLPSNAPGVHLNRKESRCSDLDKYIQEEVKMQSLYEGDTLYSLAKAIESNGSVGKARENPSKRFFPDSSKEKGKLKLKREMSAEGDKMVDSVLASSLCSVCEKKKRIS